MERSQPMKIINVPYISQKDAYPTGCESVSAVMLLNYLGIAISVDEFIRNYLDCRSFEMREGRLYGPDPRKHFCGSPYSEADFGCYAPVIMNALWKIIGNWYEIVDESGKPTNQLLKDYIDQDMPVIYWACIDMREQIIGPDWKLLDSGEDFTWISNEHCMLLVGYDDENYYFNDPYDGHGVIPYPKEIAEDRHKAQYGMAVGVKRK